MIKTHIEDGAGRGKQAHIEDNALLITEVGCPPMIEQKNKIYRRYLTDDGTTAGSNDMGIDASVVQAPFYISASSDSDVYITAVTFEVGYSAAGNLFEFADSTLVTDHNGFQFYYEREEGRIYIKEAIKTNSDLLRLCVRDTLPSDWEARHFAATNDYGYMCTIDFSKWMPPYGIKFDMGTKQKLVFTVRDNNTASDVMNVVAFGFERFP